MKLNGASALSCLTLLLATSAGCGATISADDASESESFGVDEQTLQTNALTRVQSQTVLKLIDDICGDTWCEGDYNFRFHRIFCSHSKGTCRLTFQMVAHQGGPPVSSARWASCATDGFSGFDSLVETSAGGYQSLQSAYYEALSACISRLEAGGE
jgi:hypothetical protein